MKEIFLLVDGVFCDSEDDIMGNRQTYAHTPQRFDLSKVTSYRQGIGEGCEDETFIYLMSGHTVCANLPFDEFEKVMDDYLTEQRKRFPIERPFLYIFAFVIFVTGILIGKYFFNL